MCAWSGRPGCSCPACLATRQCSRAHYHRPLRACPHAQVALWTETASFAQREPADAPLHVCATMSFVSSMGHLHAALLCFSFSSCLPCFPACPAQLPCLPRPASLPAPAYVCLCGGSGHATPCLHSHLTLCNNSGSVTVSDNACANSGCLHWYHSSCV